MFKVDKTDFLSELWSRTKSGSVLLSGSPGVGKSWTVGQLIRKCQRENRPQISLAAEDFDVRSIDELNHVLGFKNDIVSVLDSLGNDPVLIIDGLDALRGEASQRAFRELIGMAVARLPNCSVVASIRTFDLQQSEELQQLFFPVGSATHRPFSHMTVEPLSDSDLLLVCSQVRGLDRLLTMASADMRDILRNPFNLHIAARLIEAGAAVDELSAVHSQVQLLDKDWYYRVESSLDAADRRTLLRKTVDSMVSNNALSVAEQQVYSPGLSDALTGLCSSEVLRRSVTNRISFAHNILFDYAVARVALDEHEFFTFIKKDSTRTIFFRPSLSFFLHYLWWRDRSDCQFLWNSGEICGFLNLGNGDRPHAGGGSLYRRVWVMANGAQPRKRQPLARSVFVDRVFRVRIADVDRRHDNTEASEPEKYSTIQEFLACVGP